MDNAVFRLLKQELATIDESDAVVMAMRRLTTALIAQLGPQASQLDAIVDQLEHELNAVRYADRKFHMVFSGRGPMARRLADVSIVDELLYGKHSSTKEARAAKILTSFNYHPSQDPAQVHDMHHFCQELFASLQLDNLAISPFKPYPSMTPKTAQTGYYFQDVREDPNDEESVRTNALVLATTIPQTEVRLALFASTFDPARLYVYHPQECLWLQYEGTEVLPGMLECLEAELETARYELTEGYKTRDWQQEFAHAQAQAREVFARSGVLPAQLRGFSRINAVHREIVVIEAAHKVMFCNTSGDYPSDSVNVLSQMSSQGQFAFTSSFEELPTMLQCRLVSAIQYELSELMRAIVASEELAQQDAAAP